MVRGQHLPWDAVEPKCMEGGGAQKLKWKGRAHICHLPPCGGQGAPSWGGEVGRGWGWGWSGELYEAKVGWQLRRGRVLKVWRQDCEQRRHLSVSFLCYVCWVERGEGAP